jgi:hypothetical protein
MRFFLQRKGVKMYRYTIKIEIDGAEVTFLWDDEVKYEIGYQKYFDDEGGEVIYDMNGEEINTIFPRPVYGSVVDRRLLREGDR